MFITSFLIGIIFIPNVNSNSIQESNIDYEFKKILPYNSYDSMERTRINLRHNNINTENYNGTYSFTNDTIGSNPTNWSTVEPSGISIQVINNMDNHNKVMEIYDNSGSNYATAINSFTQQSFGTVEFWWYTTDNTKVSEFILTEGASYKIQLQISSGNLNYIGVGVITSFDINTWYHIRIDFECADSEYEGLLADTSFIYINNIKYGAYNFKIVGNNIDNVKLYSHDTQSGYYTYLDSISYSWTNYPIGLNKYPIIENVDSNILTPDKYEFNFNSSGNPYEYGVNNVFGWETIEPSKLSIGVPAYTSDKSENINGVYTKGYISTGTGLKNDTLGIHQEKINITFGLQFAQIESQALNTYILFYVYSLNNTEIIRLRFDVITTTIIDLEYWNGVSYQDLVRIYGIDSIFTYRFNLYLENYEVKLRWFKDDIYNDTYTFSLITYNLGINEIKILNFDNIDDANDLCLRLIYIGIYQYNISLTKEFGSLRYNLENDWIFNKYNLFNFSSNNLFKILTINHYTIYPLDYYSFRDFDNKSFFRNLLNIEKTIEKPHLYLISKTNINLSNYLFFSIEGIEIYEYIDDIYNQKYKMYYHFLNINNNYSYYYVDNNYRLRYVFNISKNDVYERLRCWFCINPHQLTNNKSIFFKGKETSINIGFPRFRLMIKLAPAWYNYTSWEIHTYLTTVSNVLRNEQTIVCYYLEIHDNNINNFTNSVSKGYIYNLRLGYYPKLYIDPSITILTLSLMAIMIPIIIMFIPTLGVYGVYRKKTVITPMLFLMSIICFTTSLIPFELFFIITISLGCLIFLQYKKGSVD